MNFQEAISPVENRLKRFSAFAEEHFRLFVVILFIMSLGIRFLLTPYHQVLREDAYIYVMKGIEISHDNFTPSLTHSIGLPLFLGLFLRLFGTDSIFQNMLYARLISVVVGSASIFPLAAIGKRLLGKLGTLLLLVFFCFSTELILSSYSVYAEPLFMLLLLLVVIFIIKSTESRNWVLAASLFGALAYAVRPNGLFILPIILISFFLMRKQIPQSNSYYFLYIIAIFMLVSAPFLYPRYACFGSPFFYGENSKYFVDSYEQVWSNNIPIPSLVDYLKTHSFADYIEKFFVRGFLKSLAGFMSVMPWVLLPFVAYGIFKYCRDALFISLTTILAVWLISVTPVYAVFSSARYFVPLIPIALIFGVKGIKRVLDKIYFGGTALLVITVALVVSSLVRPVHQWRLYHIANEDYAWAKWAAENVRGKIAIVEGGDLIMMHLPDAVVGGVGQMDIYAPESGLSIVRPGYFIEIRKAMDWLREIGTTHIALDDINIERRPYLKELKTVNGVQPYLEEIYSNCAELTQWKMRIYRIDWTEYDNAIIK
jgi:hypothetical protein